MFMETQPVLPLTASYSRGADFPPLSQLCIGQVLDQMAKDFPDSPALILSQERLRFTWRELHAEVSAPPADSWPWVLSMVTVSDYGPPTFRSGCSCSSPPPKPGLCWSISISASAPTNSSSSSCSPLARESSCSAPSATATTWKRCVISRPSFDSRSRPVAFAAPAPPSPSRLHRRRCPARHVELEGHARRRRTHHPRRVACP